MIEQQQDPDRKLTLPACPHCNTKRYIVMEYTDGVRGAKVVCSRCSRMVQKLDAEVECRR